MSGKLKSKGKFQPAVIIVIVVIAAILIATQLYRLSLHNKSGAVGNSALNLYNGGTFCADEDRVYFSNLNDHGALYSMNKELDDFKFMFDDTAGYINNTTAYIVYSRLNYTRDDSTENVLQFSDAGLYRLNKKNYKNIESFSYMYCQYAGVFGNDVYYFKPEDGKTLLCGSNLNMRKKSWTVTNGAIMPGTITEKGIIYSGSTTDHDIHLFNPDDNSDKVIYKGNTVMSALVGKHIYFIDPDNNYRIARCDEKGKNAEVAVDTKCSTYNITEDEQYAVYQVEDGKASHIELCSLETGAKAMVAYGNYNSINIIGDRVFFREYKTDNVYYFDVATPLNVHKFDPPDLTEGQ